VLNEQGTEHLLDDIIGSGFAIIAWGVDPTWGMNDEQIASWQALGTTFIQVVPAVQMRNEREVADVVVRVGDVQNRLKDWFGRYPASIAIIRPDRFVGAVAIPQTLGHISDDYLNILKASRIKAETKSTGACAA
jgi:3-(3-hydroxy-phenyl)propionate hydroxylase